MDERDRETKKVFFPLYIFINDVLAENVCQPIAIKICTYANTKARLYSYTLMSQLFGYTMCACECQNNA
jgi:hypothetical protein